MLLSLSVQFVYPSTPGAPSEVLAGYGNAEENDRGWSFGRHNPDMGARRELSSGDELDPYGEDGEYYTSEAYDPAADFL